MPEPLARPMDTRRLGWALALVVPRLRLRTLPPLQLLLPTVSVSELSPSEVNQSLVSLYTDLSPLHFQNNLCLNIQILQPNALFPLDHSRDRCV